MKESGGKKKIKKPTVSEVSQGKGGVVAAGKRTVKRVRGVGLGCKVGGVVMGDAWLRASVPPPQGLVSLSCQMKSCN